MKYLYIAVGVILLSACSSEMTVCDCRELEDDFDSKLLNASPEAGGNEDFDAKAWKEEHKSELEECEKLEEEMGKKEFNEVWQECK